MAAKSRSGLLIAAIVWIVIIGAIAVAYKYLLHPTLESRLTRDTGSESQYKAQITLATDSFSGYGILRSERFHKRLKAQGIKLNVVDDGADYLARIKSLHRGDTQMAVFTIDSLIAAGAELRDSPATIVLLLDETVGADAIIGRREGVASLQDLNDPSARIVLTPNSPSEFLARVAVANFQLPLLPERWWTPADGAEDVYKMFHSAKRDAKRAYALWEPYLSRALEEEGAVVLLDSSKLRGYIVDVLVVQREYLKNESDHVRAVVEAYLRTAYYHRQEGGMVDLVVADAKQTGARGIRKPQAEQLVQGIHWKNTLENYAHFGLLVGAEAQGLTHVEDMINQIVDVLIKTGALKDDPLAGQAHTLFYSRLLADLKANGFHPGKELNLLTDMGPGLSELDGVRVAKELTPLSRAEWERLASVGEMRIKPIAFGRGTARLNVESRRNITELVRRMKSFPQYYVTVVGHTRQEGDRDANALLAEARAESTRAFLVEQGLPEERVRATAAPPSDRGERTVCFIRGRPAPILGDGVSSGGWWRSMWLEYG